MKFCPECGVSIDITSTKFYYNCRKNLLEILSNSNANHSTSSFLDSSSNGNSHYSIMEEEKERGIKNRIRARE